MWVVFNLMILAVYFTPQNGRKLYPWLQRNTTNWCGCSIQTRNVGKIFPTVIGGP